MKIWIECLGARKWPKTTKTGDALKTLWRFFGFVAYDSVVDACRASSSEDTAARESQWGNISAFAGFPTWLKFWHVIDMWLCVDDNESVYLSMMNKWLHMITAIVIHH